MDKHHFYLLLRSLAWSALSACGGDAEDSCPHTVVTKERDASVSATLVCDGMRAMGGDFPRYEIAQELCPDLCGDPAMNHCEPPAEYLDALAAKNGPPGDAGAGTMTLQCPTGGSAEVALQCSHQEERGRWHDGCPMAGRRPSGLRPAKQTTRCEVGDYLAHAAHLEAASVLAFEQLACDLKRLGAPPQLVADCRRAAREEVAHARIVGGLARARGAEVPEVQAAPQRTPSALDLALDNMVEGVVRETYGALQALVGAQTASAPDVRKALARVAVEEASHAALSRRIAVWLEAMLTEEERAQVARARGAAVEALRGSLDSEPSAALRHELGIPSRALAMQLLDQLERNVWQRAA